MPVTNGIGHSAATLGKQEGLGKLLRMQLAKCNAIMETRTCHYCYVDMNAGSGWNAEENCAGSPLVFLETAREKRLARWRAYFIDRSQVAIESLKPRVAEYHAAHALLICGDNKIQTLRILDSLPYLPGGFWLGLLYHDPNGPPDHELLEAISGLSKAWTMDILVRYTGAGVKRAGRPRVMDLLGAVKKRHWLVGRIESGDRWQWTFLYGTNDRNLKPYHSAGFYRWDEPEAQDTLDRLNYTVSEYQRHIQPEFGLE